MTWEPLLLGLIVAILGTAALVYGTMCWEFTCRDLGKFILIIALVVAALISGTMTWGLTGKVLLAAMTWEHLLPALIVAILGTAALVYGTMRWEFTWTDLLIFVLIALGIAVLIYGTVIWGSTGKGLPAVTTWADFLPTFIGALVGTIPGTLAVILILRDRLTSYLHIALRVDLNENGFLSAVTEVENKSLSKKKAPQRPSARWS